MTFTDAEYAERKHYGKREKFLDSMERIIPWTDFIKKIEPFYPKSGRPGRPPWGIEPMLRMYFLQVWFNLADEALEETIYDSYAMRKFMRLDYYTEGAPDATTLLKFRHLLERQSLQKELFDTLNEVLEREGKITRGGTIIDATIIEAPSSTKNSAKSRDPEMKQTKKGNAWHFGMKAHIGVDAGTGMVHTVEVTGANTHDLEVAGKLIRDDDDFVNGDAGYTGIENREEIQHDGHKSTVDFRINQRKGADRKRKENLLKEPMNHLEYIGEPDWDGHIEYMKSKVRSKVEHVFAVVKGRFGYRKTVYRGLQKNLGRLYMLFCSANLLRWSWTLA
jgi:IS5 family transposase